MEGKCETMNLALTGCENSMETERELNNGSEETPMEDRQL